MAKADITQGPDGSYNITHLNQYGVTITEPLSNIPGVVDLGINPADLSSFHSYDIIGNFANSNYSPVNATDAFGALDRAPAPGVLSTTGVVNGQVGLVPPLGYVQFSVNPFDLNVTNITVNKEHILSPGLVFQQAFTDPLGNIGIETIGIGNGYFRDLNERFSGLVFGDLNNARIGYQLAAAQIGMYGITSYRQQMIAAIPNPLLDAIPPAVSPFNVDPFNLDPFNALTNPRAFDPANPSDPYGPPVSPTFAPAAPINAYDPFNAAGVPGSFDPANPMSLSPSAPPDPLELFPSSLSRQG